MFDVEAELDFPIPPEPVEKEHIAVNQFRGSGAHQQGLCNLYFLWINIVPILTLQPFFCLVEKEIPVTDPPNPTVDLLPNEILVAEPGIAPEGFH